MDTIDDTGRWAISVVDWRCQWSIGDVNDTGRWAMSVGSIGNNSLQQLHIMTSAHIICQLAIEQSSFLVHVHVVVIA